MDAVCKTASVNSPFKGKIVVKLKLNSRAELQNSRRIRIGNATESRAVDVENIAIFTRRAVYRRSAG